MTLIAEDLFLLLVDDVTGKPIVDGTKFPRVLAGAVVLELAVEGCVRITSKGESFKAGRLLVTGPAPSDPLLARAHALIGARNGRMKPQRVIEKLQRNLNKEVGSRLAQQRLVLERHDKVLGLFPTVSWPAREVTRKNWARQGIGSAIVDGTTPAPEISVLISLVSAIDAIPRCCQREWTRRLQKSAPKRLPRAIGPVQRSEKQWRMSMSRSWPPSWSPSSFRPVRNEPAGPRLLTRTEGVEPARQWRQRRGMQRDRNRCPSLGGAR